VYFQTRRRFWTAEGLRGFASTDLDIGYMLDFTAGQNADRGILATECTGAAARNLQAIPAERRVRVALEQANKVFPQLKDNFERGKVMCI
jgi:monoamine oxidase